MSVNSDRQRENFRHRLEKQKEPKLAVVQLSDTTSYPETVMVKLADTAIALPTMSTAVGLYNLARFAKTFRRHRYLVN